MIFRRNMISVSQEETTSNINWKLNMKMCYSDNTVFVTDSEDNLQTFS